MRAAIIRAALLALMLLIPSCLPPPGATLYRGTDADLRSRLGARWESINSLRLDAKVEFSDASGSYPGRLALAYRRPGKLRADIFDPMGRLRGVVVVSGHEVRDLFPAAATRPGEAALLTRLLGIHGENQAEELVAMLTALSPVLHGPTRFMRILPREKVSSPSGAEPVAFISTCCTEPVVERFFIPATSGAAAVAVEYADPEPVGSTLFPRQLQVTMAERQTALVLKYRLIELNPEVDDDVFILPGL